MLKGKAIIIALVVLFFSHSLWAAGIPDPSEYEPPAEHSPYDDRNLYIGKNTGGEVTIAINDGSNPFVFTYDRSSDRIFVGSAQGSAEFALYTAALALKGNPAEANALANRIRDFASSQIAFERYSSPPGTIEHWKPMQQQGDPYPCELAPCGPFLNQHIWLETYFGMREWHPNNPGWYVGLFTESEINVDRHRFENWRNGQCRQENSQIRQFLIGALAAGGECPAATAFGFTALACGAAVAGMLDATSSQEPARNCRSQYPGPGLWGDNP